MSASFTVNKNLIEPASGSFNNAWAAPVNSDWTAIDNAFGGNTVISVTGVTAGTYALTIAQYQPPNIVFEGTITGNLIYVLPTGVGGQWSVFNATSGAFTISLAVSGGAPPIGVLQGFRTTYISDGDTVEFADSALPAQAQANAQAFATAADAVVLSTAEAFASNAANSALTAAQTFAQNGSHINTGQVGASFLPLIGNLSGVIIQADPGGTPSGPAGTIWFYY